MARLVPPPTPHEGAATLEEPLTAAYEKILESRRQKAASDIRDEQEPPSQEVITSPEREKPRQSTTDTDIEPPHESNGKLSHAEAVIADRPHFRAVPDGLVIEREFKNGIRVLRNEDTTVVAVQFADNRVPSRTEKDILEALGQPEHVKFTYQPGDKIWTREDHEFPVPNVRDAMGMAGKMAEGRGRGR